MLVARLAVQVGRVGLAFGLVGALLLAYGGLIMVLGNRTYQGPSEQVHRREKMAYAGAGLCLAAAFSLSLISSFVR